MQRPVTASENAQQPCIASRETLRIFGPTEMYQAGKLSGVGERNKTRIPRRSWSTGPRGAMASQPILVGRDRGAVIRTR